MLRACYHDLYLLHPHPYLRVIYRLRSPLYPPLYLYPLPYLAQSKPYSPLYLYPLGRRQVSGCE